jgi:extracellular elastinolytic metalloproteinase
VGRCEWFLAFSDTHDLIAYVQHAIGEVWAEILWVVSHVLIEKHGYSPTLFPPQPLEDGTIPVGDFYRPRVMGQPLVPKHGNTLMVQ